MKIIKWGIALLLSVFFIFMGVQKFGSDNVIFTTIAANSGIGLFEPFVRILVGVAELIAAVLLLIPAARFLGALLGLGILFGAIGFHLSPWLGIFVPMESGGDPSPMLFIMAIFFTGINVVALNLEKTRIRRTFPSRPPSQAEA
jgi:uncharacterized membrane protein YphA (DoxX/SURF4 family)